MRLSLTKGITLTFPMMVSDIENYITKMEFNNDTIDLVLAALCNSLGISAILYQVAQNEMYISAHTPERGVVSRGDTHIAKDGVNGKAHYNCIGALNNHSTHCNINNEPSGMPYFSPEHVRPHPKAPPRKGKIGPRKRKTAILTDTPEKNAIEDALRK
ncbi:hypothetical protein DPMN_079751 [Dreissena polymorpha]|uniref:Uncharacterized protein n=1 Tax=Dreissena polymorpha TaxID=45954 RepID=A0A9D4BQD2_DREPO|nr:hypothetical protein DPMN_079751 [Dreissena polymorpha]